MKTHTTDEAIFLDAQAAYATGNPRAEQQDRCRACSGTGQFTSRYTGRIVGQCYTCRGTGSVSRTPVVQRVKSTATQPIASQAHFSTQHSEVLSFLRTRQSAWEWAASVLRYYDSRGQLSDGQLETAYRCMQRDAQRIQQPATAPAKQSGLDLSAIPQGRYAVPGGDTRLKILIQRPDAPSKWAGWIFASDAAEYGQRRRYGSQAPGSTYTGAIVPELTQIAANPRAAAIAYGHLTGTCCVCGRTLENAESIAAGIGPICAKRFQ